MQFNLKQFREQILKMTQTEFAELLDVSRDKVVRMEKDSDKIELETLLNIAKVTGQSLDELIGYKKQIASSFMVDDTWKEIKDFQEKIHRSISKLRVNGEKTELEADLQNLLDSNYYIKPKVAVLGMSDAGKSTFINSLLGSEEIPAYWTPATAANIHIKHISDRPSYLEHAVIILDNENNTIEVEKLKNEKYFNEHRVAAGGIELITEFGTRKGESYIAEKNLLIVVYLDKPILKVCDLLDVPGFGTGDRELDTTSANLTQQIADVVIYLSPASAYLRGEEIQFLRNVMNILVPLEKKDKNPIVPLGNLYIVASQAKAVDNGNLCSLRNILDAGSDRFYKDINQGIWDKKSSITGYDYTDEVLRSRFFTFATDDYALREPIETDLKQLLEVIPSLLLEKQKEAMTAYIMQTTKKYNHTIQFNQQLLDKRTDMQNLLSKLIEDQPQQEKASESLKIGVLNNIRALKSESVIEFNKNYRNIINEEHIINVIKTNDYKKKKDDIKRLSGYISGELEISLEKILTAKSGELSEIIENYIKEIDKNIAGTIKQYSGAHMDNTFVFDARNAFASGLAGASVLGGLAIWASTLGNLGGYILVAKAVSLLSSIGISVGGTAAAISLVSTLGGPVTFGLTFAVIATLSTFAVTSGTWKKSVSKKLVKEYEKQNAVLQYENELHKFWDETEFAFLEADRTMKETVIKEMQTLKMEIDLHDDDYLKNEISKFEEFKTKLTSLKNSF